MPVTTDIPAREGPIVDQLGRSTEPMFMWMTLVDTLIQILNTAYSGTIVTAALTGGGTQGSMTFENGVLTAQVPAT